MMRVCYATQSALRYGLAAVENKPTFKRVPLPLEILLAGNTDRHVTRVDREPVLLSLRWHVVMRRPAVPDNEIAGFSADLLPLQSVVGEPLHTVFGEAEPLWCPGWDARFIGHILVELLGEYVSTFADD